MRPPRRVMDPYAKAKVSSNFAGGAMSLEYLLVCLFVWVDDGVVRKGWCCGVNAGLRPTQLFRRQFCHFELDQDFTNRSLADFDVSRVWRGSRLGYIADWAHTFGCRKRLWIWMQLQDVFDLRYGVVFICRDTVVKRTTLIHNRLSVVPL